MHSKTNSIRELNDELRQHQFGSGAVLTSGVAGLGQEAIERIIRAIAAFDGFGRDNDPYGEHDFGSIVDQGKSIFFKIDYYDKSLCSESPDPSDPNLTERVMTVMLAEEY